MAEPPCLMWATVKVDFEGGNLWMLSAHCPHSWAAVPSMKMELGHASLCLLRTVGLCVGSSSPEGSFEILGGVLVVPNMGEEGGISL